MSTARDDVMANIRRSLGVTGTERPRARAVADRLASAPVGIIPARGQLDEPGRVALFTKQAEKASATVAVVADDAAVPGEIARFLRHHNLPATLRRGDDPRLAAMPWNGTALTVTTGVSDGSDLSAVSFAVAAVAESGTAVLVSGPDNPTSLNFLPDNHVVVVASEAVLGDLEAALARLRDGRAEGGLPRSVNLITGPSRSGDIEQTMILGAHGPRRLHVIVIATSSFATE